MAFERNTTEKVRGDSLDIFISNLSKTLTNQITVRNAEDEFNFNKLVLEGNISLDEQLSYRKDQVKRVEDDPTERARLKNEISSLKNRIEQKKFSDEYLSKLTESESGISSVDSVINWLEDQKTTTSDTNILDTINQALLKHKAAKFELTKTLLSNQTEYATKDKSAEVIDKQIENVSSARTKALLSGDDTLVSSYDLQLQSLTKAKTENSIEKDIKNFAVSSITGYSTAVKLLDAYNSKVLSSDLNSGPIKIGDVTYASAKEFWTFKRDSYVSDSSGTGFFSQLNNELNLKVKTLASKNQLDKNALASAASEYDSLTGRPELAGYESRVATFKQDTLQTGVNILGDKIVNNYAVNLDVGKAVADLSSLTALGVATDAFYTKILTAAATTKSNQVNSILAAAQTALQNDPSLTPQQALDQAVKSGAGLVLSPEQLASMKETDIAANAAKTATEGKGGNDPRTTIPGGDQTNTPGATPNPTPTPATPPAAGAFNNYVIKHGDTLSKIASENGTTVEALAALNGIQNPNLIQAGASLKIPTGTVATPPTPAPVAPAPAPTTSTTTPAVNPPKAPAVQPNPTPVAATPPPAPKTTYNGTSIVDYLGSLGQDSSYAARAKLATSKGISGYAGTADQNTQLLKTLRGY